MTIQKVKSFDIAIRNAKSMFQDFISYLRKEVGIDDEIAKALSVEVSRWEECGQERCKVELYIDWQLLGLKALERDYDDDLVRMNKSSILINFFKKANGAQEGIENAQLKVCNFERHDNADRMFSGLKESGKTIICRDADATPAWLSSHWFENAAKSLLPTLENLTFCKKGMLFLYGFRHTPDPVTPVNGTFNPENIKKRS